MENRSIDKGDSVATNMDSQEAADQARRQYMAATGEYRSMKQQKEASEKAANAYDRFAQMIADQQGDE